MYIHQEYLDNIHNTVQGLDSNSSKVLLSLLNQLEHLFPSRAEIAADWPNVRSFSHPWLKGATDRDPLSVALFRSQCETKFPGSKLDLAGAH